MVTESPLTLNLLNSSRPLEVTVQAFALSESFTPDGTFHLRSRHPFSEYATSAPSPSHRAGMSMSLPSESISPSFATLSLPPFHIVRTPFSNTPMLPFLPSSSASRPNVLRYWVMRTVLQNSRLNKSSAFATSGLRMNSASPFTLQPNAH